MPAKHNNTWINYLRELSKNKVISTPLDIEGMDKFIHLKKHTFNILNYSVPVIYLLDYSTGRYIFVSKQCDAHLNFSAEKLMDGGINFVLEKYHPADLHLFNEQIFPDRLKILKGIPAEQHKDHIFSLSYRIKDGKGAHINLLQRNSFIQSDKEGNPLLSLGVISNVNHYKEENPVIQLLEKVDNKTGNIKTIHKNTYYLREDDKLFSKREIEILLHIADGLTSKQIADKLFISEHTVINHKRNMHHKSNTQNSAGLISFAFRQRLL